MALVYGTAVAGCSLALGRADFCYFFYTIIIVVIMMMMMMIIIVNKE